MPAALAEAQRLGAGGERLLLAFVLGCEAAYHMGAATTPRAEVNAHGTWGIVGAAAAVARLRGLDAAVTGRALRLAAQLPVATAFRSSLAGATVRHAYVGAAAQLATQAVALAQAGFTALDDAPAVSFGQVLGSAFDPAALVQGLGTDFEFMRDFAKLHACCHHLYPAVDALDEVMAAGPFDVREVDVILVHTYAVASRLSDPAPGNELAAKFSLPFGLAAHALRGSLGPDAFRGTALRDPAVLALAARVQVREDPQLTARFPLERPARVEVRFAGGASRGAERRSTRGDYLDPLTPAARTAKFDSLAAPVIGDTAAKQLRDRLLRIEQVPDTSCLLDPDSRPTA
jgi:2-methylcitrate dehydratase PrpD